MKKKSFNFYKFLSALGIIAIILPIIVFFILLAVGSYKNDDSFFGYLFNGVIVIVVFWLVAFFIFRKRKYYCPKCGFELRQTGRYRDTGDFYSHEDGNRTVVTERIEIEYECPICGHNKIISEKHKIGSF